MHSIYPLASTGFERHGLGCIASFVVLREGLPKGPWEGMEEAFPTKSLLCFFRVMINLSCSCQKTSCQHVPGIRFETGGG